MICAIALAAVSGKCMSNRNTSAKGGVTRVCTTTLSGESFDRADQVQVLKFRVQSAGGSGCDHRIFPRVIRFRGTVIDQYDRLHPGPP